MPLLYDLETSKGRWSSAFFDTVGDETGDFCLGQADGSVVPVDFKLTAPIDSFVYVHRFTVALRCKSKLKADGFAGSNCPLPNGLTLLDIAPDGTERLMTNQLPIRGNADFACYSPFVTMPWNNVLSWAFNIFEDGTAYPLYPGSSLVWRVADNLTHPKYQIQCLRIRSGVVVVPNLYR